MNRLFTLLFAASCLTAVGQVPDYVPTEGLVAWWTFDGDTQDASDNQIHGTPIAASFVPDRFNNDAGAIHMEGNGLVDFGLDQRFGVVSGAGRTVAFWVKSEMQVIPRLQKYQNSVSGNSNFFVGPAPYPPFSAANGITVTANGASEYTTVDLDWSFWFHVAVVYDGAIGESTLFIDGVPVATEPLTFNTNVSSKPLQLIAARVNNDYPDSNGEVDDLGFWQRVLTHDEILALFEAPAPITGCTNPSACNFDGEAVLDDGSCVPCDVATAFCGPGTTWDAAMQMCVVSNPSDSNFDGCVQLGDLLDLLSAYGDCGAEESAWQCGDPLEYQGYDYATVLISEQCWFAENLRNENYDNGEAIPSDLSDSEWSSTTSGATAVYGEGSSDCYTYTPDGDACDEAWSLNEYGRLYNWYAVDDARGLCPSGWHVPTDGEWMTMEMALGMSESEANSTGLRGTDQGTQMKTTYGWYNGGNGTNSSGFSGLPGGYRDFNDGNFYYAGFSGYWWSSSPSGSNAWRRFLYYLSGNVGRYSTNLRYGFSVRCVRDAE